MAIAAVHAHCAVYTKSSVAQAVLDRVGWVGTANLEGRALLEPAAGAGAFVLPAVERLLASADRYGFLCERRLKGRLQAYEFERETALILREAVAQRLAKHGLGDRTCDRLAAHWVRSDDFLTARIERRFTEIVGNPPYMRWSKLPAGLRRIYEGALPPHAARGDLCLAFVCKCIDLLEAEAGQVAFLCADRWLRCAYGEAARAVLREKVRIAQHVEAHSLPVFDGDREVGAYAAVTVMDRQVGRGCSVETATTVRHLTKVLGRGPPDLAERGSGLLRERGGAFIGPAALQDALIASTELPTIEEAGITVRCGVALGHAKAFIVEAAADLEGDRLVPFVRSADLREDGTTASAMRLANPWSNEGGLVDLAHYPRLGAHLSKYRQALLERACVRTGEDWYRTIDRLHPQRDEERLFVAGMARRARVARAGEGQQPGNAIYVLRSGSWPTSELFAVLRSGLLDVFGAALSPTFSGASKRFDGNVLRQVRIPLWSDVDASLKRTLGEIDVSVATPRPELLCDLLGLRPRRIRVAVKRALSDVWGTSAQ